MSPSFCDFQNLRRERRMYQFVRSSMNLTNGLTDLCRSYASIAAVTSAISVSIDETIQRSRTFDDSG